MKDKLSPKDIVLGAAACCKEYLTGGKKLCPECAEEAVHIAIGQERRLIRKAIAEGSLKDYLESIKGKD